MNADEHIFVEETPGILLPSSRKSSKPSLLIKKEPHPSRRRRWDKLNMVLEYKKFKNNTKDTAFYSSVKWDAILEVFHPITCVLSRKKVPDAAFGLLLEYLLSASQCISFRCDGSEAQHSHLVAPILICMGSLFKGDVKITFEESLDSDIIQVHYLHRGSKRR